MTDTVLKRLASKQPASTTTSASYRRGSLRHTGVRSAPSTEVISTWHHQGTKKVINNLTFIWFFKILLVPLHCLSTNTQDLSALVAHLKLLIYMLSVERCKSILIKNGEKYSNEEISKIRDFLYSLAKIQIKYTI